MMTDGTLNSLGWRPHFAAQLADSDNDTLVAARVLAVHRARIDVAGQGFETSINLTGKSAWLDITVGDWVLVDKQGRAVRKRLDRFGLFQRRAAGTVFRAEPDLSSPRVPR